MPERTKLLRRHLHQLHPLSAVLLIGFVQRPGHIWLPGVMLEACRLRIGGLLGQDTPGTTSGMSRSLPDFRWLQGTRASCRLRQRDQEPKDQPPRNWSRLTGKIVWVA